MKIVVLDGYAANPGDISWESIEKLGQLTVHDRTPVAEIPARIADADIVLTNKAPLSASVLEGAKSLKYVGVLATGYNIVDVQAASRLGIVVCNVPGYSTMSVAHLVFALLLEITHNVGLHASGVHAGDWANSKDFAYWKAPLIELDGKVMGLIGTGSIGRAVARIAMAFGMKVIATSRSKTDGEDNGISYGSMEALLQQSDVISVHCPLTDATKDLINKDTLAAMKDGVILINTARGPIVDEQALADALRSGKVRAAGIDVLAVEPMTAGHPLLGVTNCFMTPHIGWAPLEARLRLMNITATNLKAFLDGNPVNRVN